MSVVAESTLHSTLACSKISRANSYQEHCAGGGHVVDAELDPLDQADDAVGEVPGVGRRADLVADDEDLARGRRPGAASSRRSCRRRSRRARRSGRRSGACWRPRSPPRRRAWCGRRRRAAPAGRSRRRARPWRRRRRSRWRRRRRWRRPPRRRRRRCRPRSPLTAIAASSASSAPSTSVQAAQLITTSGRSSSNFASTARGVGDVELGVAEADDVVAGVAGGEHHVAAEHPAGAGDQDLHRSRHQMISISELSPTSSRSVFGIPSLRVSFTLRPSRLASIRVPRSSTTEPARTIECSTSERRIVDVVADRGVGADVGVLDAGAGADHGRAADDRARRASRPRSSTTRPSTRESSSISPSSSVSISSSTSRLASSMSASWPVSFHQPRDDLGLDPAGRRRSGPGSPR